MWYFSDAFYECHDKVAYLLPYALLEVKQLNIKKEAALFYQISDQISDKTTSKRTTLVEFVATDVYLDKI